MPTSLPPKIALKHCIKRRDTRREVWQGSSSGQRRVVGNTNRSLVMGYARRYDGLTTTYVERFQMP